MGPRRLRSPWLPSPGGRPAAVSARSRPRPLEILERAGRLGGWEWRRGAQGPGPLATPTPSLPQASPASLAPHSPAPPPRWAGPRPRAPARPARARALTHRRRTQVPGPAAQSSLPPSPSPWQPALPGGQAARERSGRAGGGTWRPGPAHQPLTPAQGPSQPVRLVRLGGDVLRQPGLAGQGWGRPPSGRTLLRWSSGEGMRPRRPRGQYSEPLLQSGMGSAKRPSARHARAR